jgi:hypothetical protein
MATELTAVTTQLASSAGELIDAIPLVAAAAIPVSLLGFGIVRLVKTFKGMAR